MTRLLATVNDITNPVINPIIGTDPANTGRTAIPLLIRNLISTALGLISVASFIYLLYGGFQWVTAGGDKEAVAKASATIRNALIGLAIAFSLYTILWIMGTLFGFSIISFNLPIIQ